MTSLKNKTLAFFAVLMLAIVGLTTDATAQKRTRSLTEQVRKELVTLPFVGLFDTLAYKVEGDTVTLYGQVVRPTSRSSAERRVARLEGVTTVVNNIEVLPLSPYDDRIRYATVNSIANYGSLYRYFQGANPSLRVIVNRGRITLEGLVSNRTDANLAYIAARQVPGAFEVTNNLRVEREQR